MRDEFVRVPEVTLPNGIVVPTFHVGKYAVSRNSAGKAVVTPENEPWVFVDYFAARLACQAAGYELISESQWLAIAWNASQQSANWTKAKVGKGKLYRGIRNGDALLPMPGNYVPADSTERRWLVLSNGERVCDFNGNLWQWVVDDIQGDSQGLTGVIGLASPSLSTAPFSSQNKGMGYRPCKTCDWTGGALVRGGCWRSGQNAGAFAIGLNMPRFETGDVGFRCTIPG